MAVEQSWSEYVRSEFHHRPFMMPTESFAGYLSRFSRENVLMGIQGLAHFCEVPPWELFDADRKELLHLLWGSGAMSRRDSKYFLTAISPTRLGNRARYRICPTCWTADDVLFCRHEWELPMATHCRKHKTMLVDSCPKCGSALDFIANPTIDRCACGTSLVDLTPRAIPSWLPSVHWVLSDMSCKGPVESLSAEQEAAQVLQIMAGMVSKSSDSKGVWLPGDPFVSWEALDRASCWFSAWPSSFSATLVRLGYPLGTSVQADVGARLGAGRFRVIRDEILAHESARVGAPHFLATTEAGTVDSVDGSAHLASEVPLRYPRSFVPTPFPLAGTSFKEGAPLLAGLLPHALLMWMASTAFFNHDASIDLSLDPPLAFLNRLGLSTESGGVYGPRTRIWEALYTLLSCEVTCSGSEGMRLQTRGNDHHEGAEVIGMIKPDGVARGDAKKLVLSDWFFNEVQVNSFEVSDEIYQSLRTARAAQVLNIYLKSLPSDKVTVRQWPVADLARIIGMRNPETRKSKETLVTAIKRLTDIDPTVQLVAIGKRVVLRLAVGC